MEALLVSVRSGKVGLCVSKLGGFEDWAQQLVAKILAQSTDCCWSSCAEYVQLCYAQNEVEGIRKRNQGRKAWCIPNLCILESPLSLLLFTKRM